MSYFKNILKAAATGSFTLMLAACYGVAYERETSFGDVTVTDDDSNPIEGLKITLVTDQFTQTELGRTTEKGELSWDMDPDREYKLLIEDTDGEENGGTFVSKELDLENNVPDGFSGSVTLERK